MSSARRRDCWPSADSIRVTNSLLAARIDQLNLQTKYLMQDQKKVGPNLKDVRVKLRKEWVPVWLEDPQGFRPGTKMPTFWRFASARRRRPGHARQRCCGSDQGDLRLSLAGQFHITRCRTQHARQRRTWKRIVRDARLSGLSLDRRRSTAQIGGDFAANLQRVGEKANFDYIVRWIHNPRERVAPYCPKDKARSDSRGLREERTCRLFSTPNCIRAARIDGAELQVQNMTVMPNFRLSEQDSRDIATYLFSLSSPPSYADASFMDDPNLKEKGQLLIKQYGCAGCHEIQRL